MGRPLRYIGTEPVELPDGTGATITVEPDQVIELRPALALRLLLASDGDGERLWRSARRDELEGGDDA